VSRIAHTIVDSADGFVSAIKNGPHRLQADEPKVLGGADSGATPYQLLLSGLGACTAATLRMYADRKGWKLGTIHVDLELHKENEQETGMIHRIVSFSEPLTDEQKTKLLAIAEKTPVTRTIKAGAPIATELRG
jgi:putative redox protein